MPTSRRQLLRESVCGFGSLALAGMFGGQTIAGSRDGPTVHFPGRAKRVIFLFMAGAPSQMDTFDYKPLLQRDHGKDMPGGIPDLQKKIGRRLKKLQASPFKWRQHGESGLWMSELFPHLSRHADDLCMIKSMHTDGFDHGTAILRLHTGEDRQIRPSIGSWIHYGLGSENANLPGFVALSPLDQGSGTRSFGSAFLPAEYQGTPVGRQNTPFSKATIQYLNNPEIPATLQKAQLARLAQRNRDYLKRVGDDRQLEGMIKSFELAYRMQREVPDLLNFSSESPTTLSEYGIGQEPTDDFGRQCLFARRLAEAGVRFIEVTHAYKDSKTSQWDQHGYLVEGLTKNAVRVDQPISALLTDLKRRGLLEDTLIWWGGEFGRTPVNEGRDGGKVGRDHNPLAFTMWLAGGGVKPGFSYGQTDDYGYYATENRVHMHDMHATILHLMGLDHERLTYRYAGRDFRLTDVYGRVVNEIMA
jgi:hypothetical protein